MCNRAIRTSTSKGSACSSAVSTGSVRLGDGGNLARRRPVRACVLVIAVHRWSAGMMGRAGKAVNDQLSYGVAFLGDCAQVNNLSRKHAR